MKEYWYTARVNPVPWAVGPAGVAKTPKGFRAYIGREQEVYTYQQAIKAELGLQNPVMLEGDLAMTCYFWRNLATYTGPSGKQAKANVADTTNMFKATEDACQKVLFKNDRSNVVTRGFTVAQGPEVQPFVVIHLEQLQPKQVEDVLQNLPEEIYAQIYGRSGEQLLLAVDRPNTELSPDDSKYASAGDDF
jgi:Holliday junction resolvase RusA-like endonuclease